MSHYSELYYTANCIHTGALYTSLTEDPNLHQSTWQVVKNWSTSTWWWMGHGRFCANEHRQISRSCFRDKDECQSVSWFTLFSSFWPEVTNAHWRYSPQCGVVHNRNAGLTAIEEHHQPELHTNAHTHTHRQKQVNKCDTGGARIMCKHCNDQAYWDGTLFAGFRENSYTHEQIDSCFWL